jgi:hypothetical protein
MKLYSPKDEERREQIPLLVRAIIYLADENQPR